MTDDAKSPGAGNAVARVIARREAQAAALTTPEGILANSLVTRWREVLKRLEPFAKSERGNPWGEIEHRFGGQDFSLWPQIALENDGYIRDKMAEFAVHGELAVFGLKGQEKRIPDAEWASWEGPRPSAIMQSFIDEVNALLGNQMAVDPAPRPKGKNQHE